MIKKTIVTREQITAGINAVTFGSCQTIAERTGVSFSDVVDIVIELKNHIRTVEFTKVTK